MMLSIFLWSCFTTRKCWMQEMADTEIVFQGFSGYMNSAFLGVNHFLANAVVYLLTKVEVMLQFHILLLSIIVVCFHDTTTNAWFNSSISPYLHRKTIWHFHILKDTIDKSLLYIKVFFFPNLVFYINILIERKLSCNNMKIFPFLFLF